MTCKSTIRAILAFAALVAMAMFHAAIAQEKSWQREGWKTDFSNNSIDFAEVMSGGPPKDGIPSIDRPKFISAVDEKSLVGREPVIGLAINGDARAYPLRILTWHEIVNDVVGGEPVVVTYCPLCNAAIVFSARVGGDVLDFGTTGKLRNSDLIMYDRKSESWWQQFTGEGIAGAHTGTVLKALPARLESWDQFRARHPDGKVLVPNNPNLRDYGRNPYVNYDLAAAPFLYRGDMPDNISPMSRVVVVRGKDRAKPFIIALEAVRKGSPISHDGLTLSWQSGQASALNTSKIAEGTDVGTVTVTRESDTGLRDVPYDVTFAFVAHAFHPHVPIRLK